MLRLVNFVEKELATALLVSSTLGPAAIWTLKLYVSVLLRVFKVICYDDLGRNAYVGDEQSFAKFRDL